MSIRHMAAIWDDPYYTHSDKTKLLVALAIADNARGEDGRAWPSIEYIARKARSSVRGAQEAIRELEKDGRIQVFPFAGQKGTNLYVVKIPPATVAPPCNGTADEAPFKAADGCTQIIKNHQEPLGIILRKDSTIHPIKTLRTPTPNSARPLPQMPEDWREAMQKPWERFLAHCAERHKPITAIQAEVIFAMWDKLDSFTEMKATLEKAIATGNTGILPPPPKAKETTGPIGCNLA
jgi:hypothetical protein